MAATPLKSAEFYHEGWWVPGSLEAGWNDMLSANFNDMFDKLRQLGLAPLVASLPGDLNLGFYFSEAEYDFIQLLTLPAAPAAAGRLPAAPMVAYSIWLASQSWAHFSPVPLLRLRGVPDTLTPVRATNIIDYPCGWYLTGSFAPAWYADLPGNYARASKQRRALGLTDLSALYFTESALYDFVQMIQAPLLPGEVPDEGRVAEYAAWFATQGYGHLSFIPFLSLALIEQATSLASRNP